MARRTEEIDVLSEDMAELGPEIRACTQEIGEIFMVGEK
jgi:hypothetical protein